MFIHELSLTELIEGIKSGKFTQKEVHDHFLNRIKSLDPEIEAFYDIRDFAECPKDSLLAGVPVGVKEVFSEK